jgi:hypothetical protein
MVTVADAPTVEGVIEPETTCVTAVAVKFAV